MQTQASSIMTKCLMPTILLSSLFLYGCLEGDERSYADDETDSTSYSISDLSIQPGSDETTMSFTWYSSESATAELQIALKSAMVDSDFPDYAATYYSGTAVSVDVEDESESSTQSYTSNTVEVSDFEAGTEYVYRVGDGSTFSDVYDLTVQDSSSFNFILVGDPQIGSSGSVSDDQQGWQETVTQAISTFPDTSFILGVGDQINTSSDEDEYSAFLSAEEFSSIPFAPAIGNHDNNSLFQYHFNLPDESGDYGVTDAGGNYAFTYGSALFMVLNTNNSSATAHEAFIEEVIADSGTDITWKIVVLHHSIYSSASHSADAYILDLRSGLYPIFDDNEIDVVLMGHDHVYSRSYPMYGDEAQTIQTTDEDGNLVDPFGTLYITVNSASGSKYYDLEENDTSYRAFRWQGEEKSYSSVTITESSFSITTYKTTDNEVIDSYCISKTY